VGPTTPTFFVIGASKCGTTSLHHYLAAHPEIEMTARKEPHVLCGPEPWRGRLALYGELFREAAPVRGEVSPGYAALPYDADVPDRMAAAAPDARIVYVVRDPVERAVAHYAEHVIQRLEERPIELALAPDSNESVYVAASRYSVQLAAYRARFGAERVLVVDSGELRERRRDTLGRIFAHVGADPAHWDRSYEHEHYSRGEANTRRTRSEIALRQSRAYRRLVRPLFPDRARTAVRERLRRRAGERVDPRPGPELRAQLAEALGFEARRLRELTGQPFPDWSV
jgi:hypothetical protein